MTWNNQYCSMYQFQLVVPVSGTAQTELQSKPSINQSKHLTDCTEFHNWEKLIPVYIKHRYLMTKYQLMVLIKHV